ASAWWYRASVLLRLHRWSEAIVDYDRAITYIGQLLEEGHETFREPLARAQYRKATALENAGDIDGALESYERALSLREALVASRGGPAGRGGLRRPCLDFGEALERKGDLARAGHLYERAIALWEGLVAEGKGDYLGELAYGRLHRADLWAMRGETERARPE